MHRVALDHGCESAQGIGVRRLTGPKEGVSGYPLDRLHQQLPQADVAQPGCGVLGGLDSVEAFQRGRTSIKLEKEANFFMAS